MNVLAIGAHHDDVEFGCFGALSRHRQNNDKVVVAVMSNENTR
jgi:LmbE family N-acetylglucosaminyl deacetylase